MAAPSYNNIYSTGIAAGSVDFYDERYTEVRASLANEVAFFAKVKPNLFWLLKEVSYWLATWNGFMRSTRQRFKNNRMTGASELPSIRCPELSMTGETAVAGLPILFPCHGPKSMVDAMILDHGFPTVVTSTEDTRLRYLYCYASLEMLHAPYTQRFIGLFDQLRL
ncbi:hypothetical protein C8J56DRAFT_1060862 [Mycena floridula]|nr:hypothetical protein C8J56DRAFT_1060862 [Mycena floridula]